MSKFWLTLIVLLLGIGTANSEDLVSMKEMQKHFFHWSKGIHSTELPKGVDVKWFTEWYNSLNQANKNQVLAGAVALCLPQLTEIALQNGGDVHTKVYKLLSLNEDLFIYSSGTWAQAWQNAKYRNPQAKFRASVVDRYPDWDGFVIWAANDFNPLSVSFVSLPAQSILSCWDAKEKISEMLKVLLKYGAEINSSNEYGESALAFAFRDVYARSSLPAYIEETDLSDEDKQKIQELDKKEEQRVKEVFDLLFKNPPTESWASEVASGAVIYALQSGNKEKIELVRKHKLKVSFETKAAHEALLYLAMYNGSNSLKLFKELLDGGVNVNYKDATGQTALFPAVYKNNYEAVKILLEHGIDTAATDNEGKDAWKPCLRDTTIQDACQLHPLGQKYLQQHKEMNEKSPNLLMPIPHDENKPQML